MRSIRHFSSRDSRRAPAVDVVALVFVLSCGAVALAVDCNLNEIEDAEDLAAARSLDCNEDGIPDECETAPLLTRFGESFSSGGHVVTDLLVDDFSGDGAMDLAFGTAAGVALWLDPGNDSRETFSPIAASARGWSAGHLDADSNLDLVAALPGALVQLLLNQGDGTFQPATQLAFNSGIFQVLSADLNGDTVADVLVTERAAGAVEVALSQPDGTFSEPTSYTLGEAPGPGALDDVDLDGDLDLIVANRVSQNLSILIQNGDGTFEEPRPMALPVTFPEKLTLADLDGDSQRDLILVHTRAIVTARSLGDGSFEEPRSFPLDRWRFPGPVETGDLDGDADLDLVLTSPRETGIEVFWNAGPETFLGPTTLQALDTPVVTIKIADLDEDGDVDWLLGSNQVPGVRTLLNLEGEREPLTFGAPIEHGTGGEPHGFQVGDLDLDGDIDVVTANNEVFRNVSVLLNEGDGQLAEFVRIDHGGEIFSISPGDVDGDGDVDLVAADSIDPRLLLLWNDKGVYGSATSIELPGAAWYVTTSDVNGDGRDDVVAVLRGNDSVMLLRDFAGEGFTEETRIDVGSAPTAAAIMDLSGDGKPDVAVSVSGTAETVVLLNEDGGFAERRTVPLAEAPNFVTSDDFDGDGNPDLALSSGRSPHAMLLWNAGGATFSTTTGFATGLSPFSIASGDLDRDGLPDLVTAHPSFNSLRMFPNAGNREFGAPSPRTTGNGRATRFALLADLDGDDALDVLGANHDSRTITVFFNERTAADGPESLDRLCSVRDFYQVSAPSPTAAFERSTRYLVPSGDPAGLLPPLFPNVARVAVAADLLRLASPERYGDLTQTEFDQLVGRRATREYYTGSLTRLSVEEEIVFAFTVVADTDHDPLEVLSQEEVLQVYQTLQTVVSLEPLVYRPDSQLARDEASTWTDPGIPVLIDSPPDVEPPQDAPIFALEIPPETVACGVFSKVRVGRDPSVEYELQSTVRFRAGTIELPTRDEFFPGELFEEVRLGPTQEVATALDAGRFRVVRVPEVGGGSVFRFLYEQSFSLPDGMVYELRLFDLNFRRQQDGVPAATHVLDERFLHFQLALEGSLAGEPVVRYASCRYDLLPHWKVELALEKGARIELAERFEPSLDLLDTGPAALVGATIEIEGKKQMIDDYWRLVYSARRHNRGVRYWILLAPPLSLQALPDPVAAIEVQAPEPEEGTPAAVFYLNAQFERLATPTIVSFEKRRLASDVPFRRGDVNADAQLDLTDALALLEHLFARGTPPACTKSADLDDSGSLNIVDVVRLAAHLFRDGPPPAPPTAACAADPTADSLDCETFAACE